MCNVFKFAFIANDFIVIELKVCKMEQFMKSLSNHVTSDIILGNMHQFGRYWFSQFCFHKFLLNVLS